MNQEQIDRINALYRKSKAEGLTEEEKKEQALLRKQYALADIGRVVLLPEDCSVESGMTGEKSPCSVC